MSFEFLSTEFHLFLLNRRRQHRLEQEQADIEYEIRTLMAQPECNKTDSHKAREEALISRLVEVSSLGFFPFRFHWSISKKENQINNCIVLICLGCAAEERGH